MQLLIQGEMQEFIPLKVFRAQFQLPDTFAVSFFEPKDYTGLGSIEHASPQMNAMREAMLNLVPDKLAIIDLMRLRDALETGFHHHLLEINDVVVLHESEIEFAVAGLSDMLTVAVYALIGAQQNPDAPLPEFESLYHQWLFETVRVSATVHTWPHPSRDWCVQLITHAYGRIGMQVDSGEAVYYVVDSGLACPAEGYMHRLLHALIQRIVQALRR